MPQRMTPSLFPFFWCCWFCALCVCRPVVLVPLFSSLSPSVNGCLSCTLSLTHHRVPFHSSVWTRSPRGDVPVKIMSTRSRSTMLVAGVLLDVRPVQQWARFNITFWQSYITFTISTPLCLISRQQPKWAHQVQLRMSLKVKESFLVMSSLTFYEGRKIDLLYYY